MLDPISGPFHLPTTSVFGLPQSRLHVTGTLRLYEYKERSNPNYGAFSVPTRIPTATIVPCENNKTLSWSECLFAKGQVVQVMRVILPELKFDQCRNGPLIGEK